MRIIGNAISPYHAAIVFAMLSGILAELTRWKTVTTLRDLVQMIDKQLDGFHELQVVTSGGARFLCQPGPLDMSQITQSQSSSANAVVIQEDGARRPRIECKHDGDVRQGVDMNGPTQAFAVHTQGMPLQLIGS